MPKNGFTRRQLDALLYEQPADVGNPNGIQVSDDSVAHILDVRNGHGTVYADIKGQDLEASIKADLTAGPRVRVYFFDVIQLGHVLGLRLSRDMQAFLIESYQIAQGFSNQLQPNNWSWSPGRVVHYHPDTQEAIKTELWYSEYSRSSLSQQPKSSIWSSYNRETDKTTYVVLRCLQSVRRTFLDNFRGKNGAALQEHPMLAHIYFLRVTVTQTQIFYREITLALYQLESQISPNVAEITIRTQNLLNGCRGLELEETSLDVIECFAELIKRESIFFQETFFPADDGKPRDLPSLPVLCVPPKAVRAYIQDTLANLRQEVRCSRSMVRQWRERSRISINEGFALINQNDAEQNNKTAREAASIASAAREDAISLRGIQYMTMLFLPASLVSSFLGMGFFSTDPDSQGRALLIVSHKWWIWVAVSVPMTVLCFAAVAGMRWRTKRRQKRKDKEDIV